MLAWTKPAPAIWFHERAMTTSSQSQQVPDDLGLDSPLSPIVTDAALRLRQQFMPHTAAQYIKIKEVLNRHTHMPGNGVGHDGSLVFSDCYGNALSLIPLDSKGLHPATQYLGGCEAVTKT